MAAIELRVARLVAASREADTTQLQVECQGRDLASVDGRAEPLSAASVTKLIVGVILGRAVRLGLLGLDEPVCRWSAQLRQLAFEHGPLPVVAATPGGVA